MTGEILLNGENVLQMQPMEERRRIGMVFQRPNPFPTMNIYDNVLAGYLLNGIRLSKSEKDEIVERNLRSVALWDEVKDSLTKRGTFLSGGQQQRLCIARSLALKPGCAVDGRAYFCLGPYCNQVYRRTDGRSEERCYYLDRYPQHVAGYAYIRLFDVYVYG